MQLCEGCVAAALQQCGGCVGAVWGVQPAWERREGSVKAACSAHGCVRAAHSVVKAA